MADLKQLVATRDTLKAHLTLFDTYLNSYEQRDGNIALKTRLEKIEPLFDRFDEIQTAIEAIATNEADKSTAQVNAQAHESSRENRDPVQINADANVPVMDTLQIGVKLPVIKIPVFDGSPDKWLKFRDTFQSMIDDNQTLTNIQKFHYLDSAITGNAARAIEALGISAENYTTAWSTLKERFEDKRALSHFHVKGLFELPVMTKDCPISLQRLIDKSNNHLLSLKNLGEAVDGWDSMMVYLLSTKLDINTKREWEKRALQAVENPTFKGMIEFLNAQCKHLERSESSRQATTIRGKIALSSSKPSRPLQTSRTDTLSTNVAQTISCKMCKGTHHLYHCEKFLKLPVRERISEVQKHQLCFNCLRPDHQNKNCTSGHCRKCTKKHNTLLHSNEESQDQATSANANLSISTDNVEDENRNVSCNHAQRTITPVMLTTAIVSVQSSQGVTQECRVLLDGGAQSHFVTQDLCDRLKLKLTPINPSVTGIGRQQTNLNYKAEICIKSRCNAFCANIVCLVIPSITGDMPNVPIDRSRLKIPPKLTLADPEFHVPRQTDLLIGSEIFWSLLCVGQIPLGPTLRIMQKTKFGWVIRGPIRIPESTRNKSTAHSHLVTSQQLHDQVARFWALEECINPQNLKGQHEASICEDYFAATTTRNKDGRFVVSIPFKETLQNLGEFRERAHRRLLAIERKLQKDSSLSDEYKKFMQDYETAGHMTRIPTNTSDADGNAFYLPHHAVRKEGSTTTKVRVVFDGSAKTSTGLSINDVQYVGPVVQEDLFSILLRFRKHKVVISADIKQMYRQVLIRENQRKFQRILWRDNYSTTVYEFQLNTITYGMASAPYLATRALQQMAKEHAEEYPEASQKILRDFYMDDLLTGAESIHEAQVLKKTISTLLLAYGFDLRKWASNHASVAGSERSESSELPIRYLKDPKTLGLSWHPERDNLSFALNLPVPRPATKRTILSTIASIFDPLALIAPIVVTAKIILQRLWQLNLAWDEALPQDLYTIWDQFRRSWSALDKITIPRHAFGELQEIQLHGFADASEKAYRACVYARTLNTDGTVKVSLLCAKSRVAPLKTVTLPRLELCAALLLARLMARVSIALGIKREQQFFWSDSTIVLAFIASEPSRRTTFVANRTAEIQEITNENWSHVPTAENPADLASRGVDMKTLSESDLWWHGPHWLLEEEPAWPRIIKSIRTQIPDMKVQPIKSLLVTNLSGELGIRFSSFNRMVRVLTYVLRFVDNSRKSKSARQGGPLSAEELETSSRRILKMAQQQDFPSEIESLRANGAVSKHSPVAKLQPFLDSEGCIRVGGRIRNAHIPFEQKHPILISHRNIIAQRLIEHDHDKLLHAGPQLVLVSLRTRYWISSGKGFVKKILRTCVKCFRANPTPLTYQMGDLPESRVTPSRPFHVTGVDYAGPFYIREKSRCKSIIKAYLCVFVCFSTKAVHFELATDMSTNAFLNCLRRFIGRRGKCKEIHSDNGLNFIGAANEFAELRQLLTTKVHHDQVREFLLRDQITWRTIPPHAPNFGGLWESAVKSAKYHLKRV